MDHLLEWEEFLNEGSGIEPKDWDRMLSLVTKNDDGASVAKSIKDKSKAISRFIAGLKLGNRPLEYNERYKEYIGSFSDFGNKALLLGATPEEIQTLFDETETPNDYIEKLTKLSGKKLNNRFVGDISRAILDSGFDIIYLAHNGYALTNEGKDAMYRNGRKWTIGYKTEIILNDKTVLFNFDAITDEGDGPTSYIVDRSSDNIFSSLTRDKIGKQKFISAIKDIIKK